MTTEKDRFEVLRPQFYKWLRIFGIVLAIALVCIAVTYGSTPLLRLGREGRTILAAGTYLSLAGFTVIAALLLAEWLLNRYSDTRNKPH